MSDETLSKKVDAAQRIADVVCDSLMDALTAVPPHIQAMAANRLAIILHLALAGDREAALAGAKAQNADMLASIDRVFPEKEGSTNG